MSTLDSQPHRALARTVARESIVLLKNAGGVLPLRKDLGTLAVIGPNADEWRMLLGNYNGLPADPVTPLRGIREAVGKQTQVLFALGSELADGSPCTSRCARRCCSRRTASPGCASSISPAAR
jgi:beta-glucosidase